MNFKYFRKKTKLTQTEVAQSLNVRQSTISMWESGKSFPRGEMLFKVAQLYSCSTDDFFKNDFAESEAQ